MQSILDLTELGGFLGLAFSLAVLVEWALLAAVFRGIAAGLRTAAVPTRKQPFRKVGG